MTSEPLNRFKIKGIHHPAFATPDIKKTTQFWQDLLGFKLVLSYRLGNTSQHFFALSNSSMVSFFEWESVENPPYKRHGQEVEGVFQLDHLAFELATRADLFKLQDELVESDIPVTDIIDHGFIYSLYTFDPNRIALEFNCRTRDIDLISNPMIQTGGSARSLSPNTHSPKNTWDEQELHQDLERLIIDGEGKNFFV